MAWKAKSDFEMESLPGESAFSVSSKSWLGSSNGMSRLIKLGPRASPLALGLTESRSFDILQRREIKDF